MKARVMAADAYFGPGRPGVALSPDGRRWLLLNAAAKLQPRHTALLRKRDDLQAVLLTDAGPDHASGLLSLRNGNPIDLYATPAVFERLTVSLPVLPVLQHYCGVHWHLVAIAGESRHATFRIEDWPTLEFTAMSIGLAESRYDSEEGAAVGDNIALAVRDLVTGRRLFVAPALDMVGPEEADWMDDADCVLVARSEGPQRGSAYRSPGAAAYGSAGAAAVGPVEHPSDDRLWLWRLARLRAPRKVLLCEPPVAGIDLGSQGLEVAYDGMEIDL